MKKIQIICTVLLALNIFAIDPIVSVESIPGSDQKISIKKFLKPENFVADVTNPYYPLSTGDTTFYYVVEVDEAGDSSIETSYVVVTSDAKTIEGINCKVIHDVVMADEIIVEETFDWYAQDIYGNVWYFGEATQKLQSDGSWNTTGSWEHGIDGAIAGIIMAADPANYIGIMYRQEQYKGYAQDKAIILSDNETVTIGLGTYSNCLLIEESTPLEPDVTVHKWYATGIGEIKKSGITGVNEEGELTGKNF
jgi:hypothetical protein